MRVFDRTQIARGEGHAIHAYNGATAPAYTGAFASFCVIRKGASDGLFVATTESMTTMAATQSVGAMSFIVRATAVVVALAFSTGMALAFELALDAQIFG